MRVAFVIPYLREPCGWRSASVGIITALKRYCAVEPVVVVSRDDARDAEKLLAGMPIVTVPETQFMRVGSLCCWPKLAATRMRIRTLRIEGVDLVHSIDAYPTGLVGHWLGKRLRVPHVLTALGTYAVRWHAHRLDNRAYRAVLRSADALCPMSRGTEALMREHYADVMGGNRTHVVLFGCDYHLRIPRDDAYARTPAEQPTILSVGEVKGRKGHHISLRAFATIQKQYPQARYWIVGVLGSDSYKRELDQYIGKHNLKNVEFFGEVSAEKLDELYRRASIFLLASQKISSNFEGFGLVFLEAGAYGLPVVGSRTGGVPDAVKDGITGFLAQPESPEDVADAVLKLLANKELAKKMGRANRDWAETLTWQRYARQQFGVYESVLGRAS